MTAETVYDAIIIGAGPGGLQAAIYLGRYNRKTLLIDRGGGRTHHARHIENFLTQPVISGKELIAKGLAQAERFGVEILKGLVTKVLKRGLFEVFAGDARYFSKSVIVSSGAYDNLPSIENLHRFLGTSLFTCVDCDGYRTTGRKLVVIGNSLKTVHLAIAMKEMYTKDITLALYTDKAPEEYREVLGEEGIRLVVDKPVRIVGVETMEGLELRGGEVLPCEVIMSHFGYKLNDGFLSELALKKDAAGFKYVVNANYESSLDGLYIVGPLNTGTDQAIVAAGEGAVAAIDLKRRLIEI